MIGVGLLGALVSREQNMVSGPHAALTAAGVAFLGGFALVAWTGVRPAVRYPGSGVAGSPTAG